MALTIDAVRLLSPHLRHAKILALGYPDMLMSRAEVASMFGIEPLLTTSYGDGHKWKHEVVDTEEVLAKLGSTMVCCDIYAHRGVEEVRDLNNEQAFYGEKFDLVIDAGTIEHCANIGQALMNAANAVRPGGRVFHSPPLTMVNHGFYNVCPTLLHDFYTQNGWVVEHLSAFDVRHEFAPFPIHATGRTACRADAALYFLAQRLDNLRLHWPTQTKYAKKT